MRIHSIKSDAVEIWSTKFQWTCTWGPHFKMHRSHVDKSKRYVQIFVILHPLIYGDLQATAHGFCYYNTSSWNIGLTFKNPVYITILSVLSSPAGSIQPITLFSSQWSLNLNIGLNILVISTYHEVVIRSCLRFADNADTREMGKSYAVSNFYNKRLNKVFTTLCNYASLV
jgi:hypothetical protein